MKGLISLVLFQLISFNNGFTTTKTILRQPTFTTSQFKTTSLAAAPSSPEELINNPSIWQPIKEALNIVPAFTCTNEQGQPLQYAIGGSMIAFFYLDIDAAKYELETAQKEATLAGNTLKLNPFPLGEVFELAVKQKALLVPSQEAITAAGAPSGTSPVGQQVPLFGCMELLENLPDGSTTTPLFLDQNEAEEAMSKALQGSSEVDKEGYKVEILPLSASIQKQATSQGKKSYTYVSPRASIEYLSAYQ